MITFESYNPTGLPLPKQNLIAHYDEETQDVFLSSIGPEQSDLLCAAYDGVPLITYEGHSYFPANWLMQEHPDLRGIYEAMKAHILSQVGGRQGEEP